MLSADQGEEIQRSYTPTSRDVDVGHFDLVVKIYKKGECAHIECTRRQTRKDSVLSCTLTQTQN